MQESPFTGAGATPAGHGSMSCFSVYVGELMFGLPVADTQSIFRIDNVTPVPLSPAQVAGLTNLRGRALAVISLKSKFDGTAANVTPGALAIGLQVAGEDYALVVDRVGEVMTVDLSQRMPVPSHIDVHQARLTEGLYKVGDDLLSVLNVRELFDVANAQSERNVS